MPQQVVVDRPALAPQLLYGAAAPGRDDQRRPVAACRTAWLGAHRADRRLRLEHCRSTTGRYAQTAAAAAISTGGLSSLNVPGVVHSAHFRVVTPIRDEAPAHHLEAARTGLRVVMDDGQR